MECHRGSLFSDFKPHVTGVEQRGEHAPVTDGGHAGTGAFVTPALRNVGETGPYMHDGSLETLADVIWFYRQGGAATGYVGTKDPLIQPLEITDDEARDLEAFLGTLTGTPIDPTLTTDIRL
jgi:cytochrome c peroxidase